MISGWAANAGLIVRKKTIVIRNSIIRLFCIKSAPPSSYLWQKYTTIKGFRKEIETNYFSHVITGSSQSKKYFCKIILTVSSTQKT